MPMIVLISATPDLIKIYTTPVNPRSGIVIGIKNVNVCENMGWK